MIKRCRYVLALLCVWYVFLFVRELLNVAVVAHQIL